MSNTCTICRHDKRPEIEDKLVQGVSLRSIGKTYQTTHTTLNRHRSCIAASLRQLRLAEKLKAAESLVDKTERYGKVAERHLDADDPDLQLRAVDRCLKRVDLEAKLKGEFQKKQANQPDAQRKQEIVVEAYCKVFEMMTEDEALESVREVYRAKAAQDIEAMREAVRAAIEADTKAIEQVWHLAEEIVSRRVM